MTLQEAQERKDQGYEAYIAFKGENQKILDSYYQGVITEETSTVYWKLNQLRKEYDDALRNWYIFFNPCKTKAERLREQILG